MDLVQNPEQHCEKRSQETHSSSVEGTQAPLEIYELISTAHNGPCDDAEAM